MATLRSGRAQSMVCADSCTGTSYALRRLAIGPPRLRRAALSVTSLVALTLLIVVFNGEPGLPMRRADQICPVASSNESRRSWTYQLMRLIASWVLIRMVMFDELPTIRRA